MFENNTTFKELISGVKLELISEEGDEQLIDNVQARVGGSSPSTGAALATPPKNARKTLTASQRQALMGLRAMS